MKCRMVKGGVVGLALASAAMFWIFGGKAWDLISAKAEKAREAARAAMTNFDDEITLARKAVDKLTPAIEQGAVAQAKLEESVRQATAEVATLQAKVDARGRQIEALRAALDSPSVHRVGGSATSAPRRIETDLKRAIDDYRNLQKTLGYAQDTLQYRKALVQTSKDQLMEMKARRQALLSKIEEIEARHKARIASRQFNEFTVDTSPLAEAEKAVAALDSRENVETRTDELKSELSDLPTGASVDDATRDVRREADEILHQTTARIDRDA
jgi:chromosome segregation ATPase